MRARFVALAASAFLMQGCPFDPNVDFYTTVEPARKDLIGRYTLIRQSVTADGLSAVEDRPCELELGDDGTFSAANVPAWGRESTTEDFFQKLEAVSGTWGIDNLGSIANGDRPPKTHWGIILKTKSEERITLGLTGLQPPFGLIFWLGDHDNARTLYFEKIQAAAAEESRPQDSDR